ncbi:redoxin domain-containing protein [Flavobacterium alkalisoli]|uniref:Redoxin domain-containing protein n=1 Tax=Flavobacterium alkalisoli TaxID=2602769 RepID=A0A5B9FVM3_9FLAO|nr:redoxin family protein [Flavobacterium alkalisoli]QEE51233.1 redoxin domain-containing protein [Flavobacterium alkalisoli]
MQTFLTALKAEHLKRKGTGVYLTSIIIAAIIPIIYAIITIIENRNIKPGLPYNYFTHTLDAIVEAFAGFFFPLIIIISASRLTQLDHKNGGWQLMETQPIKKLSIYFSKFSILLITNLIAIATYIIVTFIGSYIMYSFLDTPDTVSFSFEFSHVFWLVIRLFLASLTLSALQYVICVLLPSFIWPILIGVAIILGYLIAVNFMVFPAWYPMEMLYQVSRNPEGSQLGYWITYSECVSVICSLLLLYIGFEWYKHKNFVRAFAGNGARTGKLAGVVIVLGGLLWYTLIPNVMEPYGKTVIAGEFESENNFDTLYLVDNFVNDTIAVIPVKDNKFNYHIDKNLPLDFYTLNMPHDLKGNVVIGNNDSVYIKIKANKDDAVAEYRGTRLAENQYKKEKYTLWSNVNYMLQNNSELDKPDYFIRELVKEWKGEIEGSKNFKTTDNYVPREDYRLQEERLITIKYLVYWNSYVKKRIALYPDQQTLPNDGIKEMMAKVPLDDEGLLSDQDYFSYLKNQIIADNKEELDENTKTLQGIEKLDKGTFRDKMLYWQMRESLQQASNTTERDSLMAKYTPLFTEGRYITLLASKVNLYKTLEKGNKAPLFDGVSNDKKNYTLDDFKGKYVVIDVWATWCGPCREQSPKFERFAFKYKDEQVQFIALSVDRRIDNWYVEVNQKSKSVLQLHANNVSKFMKEYNVQGIPRFILIDPDGNFVNSELPYPSEANFEKMLRDALNLGEEK